MSWRPLAELAGFQLVWLACAVGAARGYSDPGLLAAGLYLVAQLAANHWSRTMCLTVLAAGMTGFAAESMLVALGFVRYTAAWPSESLAPAWIVGLWLAFATTLETLRRLIGARPLLKSALLGAIVAPIAYLAAARIGALSLPESSVPSCLAIAATWGLALPLLMAIQMRVTATGGHRAAWR